VAQAHEAMRIGAIGLLDRIGPSVLLTHSMGGGFGWLAASERREKVRAIVAVEPAKRACPGRADESRCP
jgi:pimeloyl-ACP methyl ester carboxylesterase